MDLPGEEEQKELITAWLSDRGDGEAVIESFLPQILEIARNHMGKGVLFGDLVQEGNIGLLEAMAIYQGNDAQGFLCTCQKCGGRFHSGCDRNAERF
ncbi:MAG: sigma factor [Anaerostipes sp.]